MVSDMYIHTWHQMNHCFVANCPVIGIENPFFASQPAIETLYYSVL